MTSGRVVQRGLRTPTGLFFARFFIDIILGLVAEFAFMVPSTRPGYVVFRCTLDGSQADRWLEVPAWMFDRTACPDAEPLTAQPFVATLAYALPSKGLPSGAARTLRLAKAAPPNRLTAAIAALNRTNMV
jgi:hypothetical protein